jgi:hypothetical protein
MIRWIRFAVKNLVKIFQHRRTTPTLVNRGSVAKLCATGFDGLAGEAD